MNEFDKYILLPAFSKLSSRKDVDLTTKLTKQHSIKIPIISSPMSCVTEFEMALAMNRVGAVGVIHRYMKEDEQAQQIESLKKAGVQIRAASIGVNGVASRIEKLVSAGANVLFIDVAHGDMVGCYDLTKSIKKKYGGSVEVVSGNIVTPEAAERYYYAEIDALRVGVGPGAGCTTRAVAGVGRNQLESIVEVFQFSSDYDLPIISDGGSRQSGDMVKCLATGASTIMVGQLLAVARESAARKIDGKFVEYYGMASKLAEERRIERTGETREDLDHIRAPEGREILLPYEDKTVQEIVNSLSDGIKHGFAYLGAKDVDALRGAAEWCEM